MPEHDQEEWTAKYDPHMGWVVDGVCAMLTDYEGTPGEARLLAASKKLLRVAVLLDSMDCCTGYTLPDGDFPTLWKSIELAREILDELKGDS